MVEEAIICVIWTYSHYVHNPWDEIRRECDDECLKTNMCSTYTMKLFLCSVLRTVTKIT
jgi:hypothetical protein